MKITIDYDGTWWDWEVEGDPNARGTYSGAANSLEYALESIGKTVARKARDPWNPKVRTEY